MNTKFASEARTHNQIAAEQTKLRERTSHTTRCTKMNMNNTMACRRHKKKPFSPAQWLVVDTRKNGAMTSEGAKKRQKNTKTTENK